MPFKLYGMISTNWCGAWKLFLVMKISWTGRHSKQQLSGGLRTSASTPLTKTSFPTSTVREKEAYINCNFENVMNTNCAYTYMYQVCSRSREMGALNFPDMKKVTCFLSFKYSISSVCLLQSHNTVKPVLRDHCQENPPVLSWEHCQERPPVLKNHTPGIRSHISMQLNLSPETISYGHEAVSQDRFYCTCIAYVNKCREPRVQNTNANLINLFRK